MGKPLSPEVSRMPAEKARRTQRPRILMLVTSNQRRGAESFAAVVSGELANRGFDIKLRSLSYFRGAPCLPIEPLGRSPFAPRTLLKLRREIERSNLVVACGSKTLPASVLAGLRVGCPVIYQNIGDPLYWARGYSRRARVRALLRRVAAVAALTEESSAVLQSTFGVPEDRIRVISNARDSTQFRPAGPLEKGRARRKLGLVDDHPVVAIVAALSPEKRVDMAISAVGRTTFPTRLLVVGEGPLRPELEQHATSVAPGRVSFLGTRDDMSTILRAADVLVLTSMSEGVPGVLIEAGLSGLPVVSTDVGYVDDIVVHGRTGLLVPPGDVDGLVVALECALRDRNEMGAAGRQRCVEKFALERVSNDWADLIRRVLCDCGGTVDIPQRTRASSGKGCDEPADGERTR